MSPPRHRAAPCNIADARFRLAQARKFHEVALVAAAEHEIDESIGCAAALEVLAGIAASDAACCAALGQRSRSDNHMDAAKMLEQILVPDGTRPANALRRMLRVKDNAHYGLERISVGTLTPLQRQAETLIAFAEEVIADR